MTVFTFIDIYANTSVITYKLRDKLTTIAILSSSYTEIQYIGFLQKRQYIADRGCKKHTLSKFIAHDT